MHGHAVSLREFKPDDVESVYRWFNNDSATRMLIERRTRFTPEDAERWTGRAMDASGKDRKFAIEVAGNPRRSDLQRSTGSFAKPPQSSES